VRSFEQIGYMPHFISDILCYFDYLKSVFIQNKCVFNKYKSYKLKCQDFFKKQANVTNKIRLLLHSYNAINFKRFDLQSLKRRILLVNYICSVFKKSWYFNLLHYI